MRPIHWVRVPTVLVNVECTVSRAFWSPGITPEHALVRRIPVSSHHGQRSMLDGGAEAERPSTIAFLHTQRTSATTPCGPCGRGLEGGSRRKCCDLGLKVAEACLGKKRLIFAEMLRSCGNVAQKVLAAGTIASVTATQPQARSCPPLHTCVHVHLDLCLDWMNEARSRL